MTTRLKFVNCLLLLYIFGVSCGIENQASSNDKNQMQATMTRKGDSALTLLMREMFDDVQAIKQAIENGDSIKLSVDHEKILSAQATQPEKVFTEAYQAFAVTYLQALKNIQTVHASQQMEAYGSLVKNCMTCHQSLCPGPIVKIKKLL